MSSPTPCCALRPSAAAAQADALAELEELVQETFALWSARRVGWSWRCYYWEHTQRVRSLCRTLAAREGADADALEFAALLHDITKRYDGPIQLDSQGKRVVDERGFWRAEPQPPDRGANIVTALYEWFDEFGEPHSESGADIAHALLLLKGFEPGFARRVADIVRAHLRPADAPPSALNVEQQILCDADLIDANFGLVAFFRNVKIHQHRRREETGRVDLREYVEYVPQWLNSKHAFFERMHLPAARALAKARRERCFRHHERLREEARGDFELNRRFGLLGVFDYFMSCLDDPDFFGELAHLEQERLPRLRSEAAALDEPERRRAADALARAEQFCRELRLEAEGAL